MKSLLLHRDMFKLFCVTSCKTLHQNPLLNYDVGNRLTQVYLEKWPLKRLVYVHACVMMIIECLYVCLQVGRVVGIDGEWRPAVAKLRGSRSVAVL